MNLTSKEPTDDVIAARIAVVDALRPYQAKLSNEEMLAIMSFVVGQILALQDQKEMTAEMGMELIMRNIEAGNAATIAPLMNTIGNA